MWCCWSISYNLLHSSSGCSVLQITEVCLLHEARNVWLLIFIFEMFLWWISQTRTATAREVALIFLAPERRLNLGMWENLHIFQAEVLKKRPTMVWKRRLRKTPLYLHRFCLFPKTQTETDRHQHVLCLLLGEAVRPWAVVFGPDADGSRSLSIRLFFVRNSDEPQDLRGWESSVFANKDMPPTPRSFKHRPTSWLLPWKESNKVDTWQRGQTLNNTPDRNRDYTGEFKLHA